MSRAIHTGNSVAKGNRLQVIAPAWLFQSYLSGFGRVAEHHRSPGSTDQGALTRKYSCRMVRENPLELVQKESSSHRHRAGHTWPMSTQKVGVVSSCLTSTQREAKPPSNWLSLLPARVYRGSRPASSVKMPMATLTAATEKKTTLHPSIPNMYDPPVAIRTHH